MKKVPAMLFVLVLVSATLAVGSEQPASEDTPATQVELPTEPETIEESEIPEVKNELFGECTAAESTGEDTKVLTGFGPHCSTPFTCTHQEPGLGFGCTCTYSCSCAYCNGQLTKINCQLIDDGGCFACPS